MIRRAPHWYTGSEKSWQRLYALWPWAAGLALGGLYAYDRAPLDDVMRAGFSSVRKSMLNTVSKLESLEDDHELGALELPPDRLFGPLPLKQQMFFAKQALEEENELGDSYITRMITDRIDFGLQRVDEPQNEFYDNGGEGLHNEAVLRYRDFTNQRVKFFNCDRFIRLLNISLESKPIAINFLDIPDGISLILKAMKETSALYTPHLGTRALTLLAMQQPRDGTVEHNIASTPDGIRTLCEVYANTAGDPQETRFVTLLLSSILRTVPGVAQKFHDNKGLDRIFAALNVAQCKGMPQHLRVYKDILAKDPKGVRHYLHTHESPIPILLGVAKGFTEFFGIQEQLYDMLQDCVEQRSTSEFLAYGGMDIMHKAITAWPPETKNTVSLHQKWQKMYRKILNDPECTKYRNTTPELQEAFVQAEKYLAENEKMLSVRPA
ncbi:hypothetical protein XU18_4329 [Perkinsela sp. CCAP 1560/4]|nr:hypothetical protein XU18_4329 [Perkinsela sp. CCAP 1560/4]|eukprot:KNH04470.1 hypothetical protein XU18_4329 [Perkinsela sp. CCAP 1560/4]